MKKRVRQLTFSQDPPLGIRIRLQRRRLHPDLDRLRDLLDRLPEDDLGVLGRVELGGMEPDVFVFGTFFAPLRDDLSGSDHLLGVHCVIS